MPNARGVACYEALDTSAMPIRDAKSWRTIALLVYCVYVIGLTSDGGDGSVVEEGRSYAFEVAGRKFGES
jgi:hypothetical protein